MSGRPIWQAYQDTNALAVACPHCNAQTGTWCTKPDGRVARVPCVDRIAAADLVPAIAHDFSEPRHPKKHQQNGGTTNE